MDIKLWHWQGKSNFQKEKSEALEFMIIAQITLGNDSKALQMDLQGLKIAEKNNLIGKKAALLELLGNIYNGVKNYTKALDLLKKSKALFDSLHDFTSFSIIQNCIGETYLMHESTGFSFVLLSISV